MKKLARTFLTIGKVFSVIEIVSFAVCVPIFFITLFIGVGMMQSAESETAAAGIVLFSTGLACTILFAIFLIASIVGLVLTIKSQRGLNNAKCKADAKGPAIMAIIAGVLLGEFQVAAGIIMLVAKESVYSEGNAQDEPVEATIVE